MKKIDKLSFLELIKNLLQNNIVPPLSDQCIQEFKIGKNYFYKIIENPNLIIVQTVLNKYFQVNVELNNAAVAFRKNYSYLHLFEPHKKNYNFLRLDIKSFFHSIDMEDVAEVFKYYFVSEENLSKNKKIDAYIDDEKKQTLLDAFINLISYVVPIKSDNEKFRGKKILPMGFITSPVISNIIFRKIDIQIQKFCSERNILYTRYADDMLFSSAKDKTYVLSDNFINEISIQISKMNFKLNKTKTVKARHTISLNGYTLQYSNLEKIFEDTEEIIINEIRISNKKTDIIKKLIYMINIENKPSSVILKKLFNFKLNPERFKYPLVSHGKIKKYYDDQLLNKITGYRSYLLSVVIFNTKYDCTQKATIEKYLSLVEQLNQYIEKNSPM